MVNTETRLVNIKKKEKNLYLQCTMRWTIEELRTDREKRVRKGKGKRVRLRREGTLKETLNKNSGQSIFDERRLLLDNKYLLSVYDPQKFPIEEYVVQVVVKGKR